MKILNQLNLTYCSNVFIGNTWTEIFNNLKTNIPKLKSQLAPNLPFAIGLRLSSTAAKQLLAPETISCFKLWLAQTNCYVVTLNGFVYGNFYNEPVKEKVYEPDWSTPERFDFNISLIEIASSLCPTNAELGFSTAPISYKFALEKKYDEKFIAKVVEYLAILVKKLMLIFKNEKKIIHIDLEPEADCFLETIDDVVQFFYTVIFNSVALKLSSDLQINFPNAITHTKRHLQICYDICHQSVQFEDHIKNFNILNKSDIKIGKIQISSALRFQKKNQLSLFSDNIYLHQTVVKDIKGVLKKYRDLNQLKGNPDDEVRVHYHLPVFIEKYENFSSTNNDILDVLAFIKNHSITSCLEIETYTWQVLPKTLQLDIITSIRKEYEWVIDKLV